MSLLCVLKGEIADNLKYCRRWFQGALAPELYLICDVDGPILYGETSRNVEYDRQIKWLDVRIEEQK